MNRPRNYITVSGKDWPELHEAVKYYMKMGWEPIGSPVIDIQGFLWMRKHYVQAMVKEWEYS